VLVGLPRLELPVLTERQRPARRIHLKSRFRLLLRLQRAQIGGDCKLQINCILSEPP
jgi:hypothetical protein